MRKEIKRIAAILIACCLLMGLLYASIAEETAGQPEVEMTGTIPEIIAAEDGTVADPGADNAGLGDAATDENSIETEVTPAPVTEEQTEALQAGIGAEETPVVEETPTVTDAEGYVQFIDNGKTEYREIDNGGGTMEPEVLAVLVPEVTEELIEASSHVGEKTDEQAEEQPATENTLTRAWITSIPDENAIILKANAKPALTGKVTWQIHKKGWPEDNWEEIGIGDRATLELTEVSTGDVVCFRMEDGTVSELYEIKIIMKEEPLAEEPAAEASATEKATAENSAGAMTEDAETGEGESDSEKAYSEKSAEEGTSETEPAGEKPETDEASGEESAAEGPADETTSEEPAGEKPATEEPADGSTSEEPAGEESAAEKPADEHTGEEPAGEEPTTEETADKPTGEEPAAEEPTDEPDGEEPAGEYSATEGSAEETTNSETAAEEPAGGNRLDGTAEHAAGMEPFDEEPGEPVTLRAWITGMADAHAGETVTLNANAEPELTGVSTWQIRNEQVEDGKWKRAGYGDHLTVDLAEGDEYRFVMQDGTVSEVLKLAKAPEETADENAEGAETAEEKAETGEDAETTETKEPDEQAEDAEKSDDEGEEPGEAAEGAAAATEDGLTEAGEPEGTEESSEAEKTDEAGEPEETEDELSEEAGEPEEAEESEDAGETEGTVEMTGSEEDLTEMAEDSGEPEVSEETEQTEESGEEAGAEEDEAAGDQGEDEEPAEDAGENAEDAGNAVTEEPEGEEPEEPTEGEESVETGEPEETEEDSEAVETDEPEDEPAEELVEERALPENRSAVVSISWDEEQPGIGSVAHFSAQLTGYEELNYTVQWIMSTDNENWTEIEGATGETMDVVVTEDNYLNYWRIRVHIEGFKDLQ